MRRAVFAWVVALAALGCDRDGVQLRFVIQTPYERYRARLRELELDLTALGRDWIAAGKASLTAARSIELPYRETRYLDPRSAAAQAYRLKLERGQRLAVRLEMPDSSPLQVQIFLDLFWLADSASEPQLVASAEAGSWELEYVAMRPGTYLLRVQPELLRGGRVTVTLRAHASLAFPVHGRDIDAIRSVFGAPRDGGRRTHHGIDIFAPRGTPVIAAAEGRISRVTTNRLGGNVIWLREARYGRRLYYAHLDRHAVAPDTWVKPGDTIGFVGNTGNARTTPPHLHFGIYLRGEGPVDPFYHVFEPRQRPPEFAGDPSLIGSWARVSRRETSLRAFPAATGAPLERLQRSTAFQVLAGTGRWYLARLPDGREGYLPAADAEPLKPLGRVQIAQAAALRTVPGPMGEPIATLPRGQVVTILGRYGSFALVLNEDHTRGWVDHSNLAAVAALSEVD
ncbi:MAG: hypothetical protein KatS3mg081_1286 [Gemmatimonadales bacterium]|nr:MAG: hypothetical protein KatS3mg081_1286 [Gemmatimonadales bacterium]